MPKGKRRGNLALEEAELKKTEELNRRKKKALEEQAELMRQERELEAARVEDEPEPDAEVLGPPRGTDQIDEKLEQIVTELEEGGKFWVFRLDERGRSSQCGAWPVADWPARMEEIAHEAGGGVFKIQFKRSNGTFVRQTTLSFDPKFYGKKEEAKSGPTDFMMVLSEMQKQTAALVDSSRRDMMDMMKTIVTVVGGKSGPNYQEIATLGALFKGDGESHSAVEMLKTGIEMGMKLKEGAEPPSTLDRVLESVGGPAVALLTRMAAAPAPRRPMPAAPVAPPRPVSELAAPGEAAVPPSAPAVPSEVDLIRENVFYKTYVPKILAAAKAGEKPEEWAEYITDIIPAIYHPKLLGVIENPDLVEYLGQFEPEARNYAGWITSVRNAIMELFPSEEVKAEAPAVLKMVPAETDDKGNLKKPLPPAVVEALTD